MGVPKGAGNLRGARDKNWTVVAACLRSFRRALTAVHPEPARGPTLVTSATQLKIGEPCEFSAKPLNSPKFLDVTLQSRPTENGVSPPLGELQEAPGEREQGEPQHHRSRWKLARPVQVRRQ